MKNAVPFTPGPLRPSALALDGLANPPATHHREQPFIDMMATTEYWLRKLLGFSENPAQYFATVMTCTGTGANEAVLRALRGIEKPGLILNNGYFAQRLISQAFASNLSFTHAAFPSDIPLTAEHLIEAARRGLGRLSDYGWVYFVAHETRAGLRNAATDIARAAQEAELVVACDAISAAYAYPFDPAPYDFLVASSAKGINSVAGLGIVFCRGETIEALPFPTHTHYLDLVQEYQQQRYQHRPQFAQSIPLHSALHGACLHLLRQGMVNHYQRIQYQMRIIVDALGRDNLVLPSEYCAFVTTNFRLPPGRAYPEFAKAMAARGYFLLCGIPNDDTHFQVSTLGQVTDYEVSGLITDLRLELAQETILVED